jgi:hypothetical protein
MAPLDIPHHWKQIKHFSLFEMADVEEPSDQEEDQSDSEDDTSLLDVSDIEEVIAFVLHGATTDEDSVEFNEPSVENEEVCTTPEIFAYHQLPEEDQSTTPVRHNVPTARRRLFDSSSGEEDENDDNSGVTHLD